jgi:hypothetical protein
VDDVNLLLRQELQGADEGWRRRNLERLVAPIVTRLDFEFCLRPRDVLLPP